MSLLGGGRLSGVGDLLGGEFGVVTPGDWALPTAVLKAVVGVDTIYGTVDSEYTAKGYEDD